MMEESTQSQQENVESTQGGELSREELLQKCRYILAIAQKAKTARDEALEEQSKLLKEVEDARTIIRKKDEQYKNVEEIMGALTDQKLKLAMDMDTLKKEKVVFLKELKAMTSEKENYESEAESLRRRYDRLLSENEDLIGELQIRERSESQLLSDIKKLHENNENVKILCTNVTQEKIHLEEELGKMSNQVEELTAERNLWNQTLCPKLGINRLELKDLVSLVDGMSPPGLSETIISEDGRIEELSQMLLASQKDNDTLQQEITLLKDKTQRLMSELETANVDRDKMMTNLEGVRVETKTLIENVEKLTEEIDVIKLDKQKSEGVLNRVIDSKNEEIDSLLKELSKNKACVNELLTSLEMHMGKKSGRPVNSEEFLKVIADNEQLRKTLAELQRSKTTPSKSNVDRNVLFVLKEGIVSNLTDLADTMPEYSREFLNKLDAILEGADCQGEVGADIFVHYFNECLSQLKISLKENEILSKEVGHLKTSIRDLESSVANHNKDCELLRCELEELSSDSNRLLLDLSNLRHENSIRVTEIGELVARLKQRDEQLDHLKEANYQLEIKYSASINELTTQLADANNKTVQLQEQNKQLESQATEYKTLLADIQSGSTKEVSAMEEELASAKQVIASLQKDLEESQSSLRSELDKLERVQSSFDQAEEVKDNSLSLYAENDSLRLHLEEIVSKLNQQTAELETVKKSLADSIQEKAHVLENSDRTTEDIAVLQRRLEELQEAFKAQSLELANARQGMSQNENLTKELENAKKVLNEKSSALEDAERHLRDSAEVSSELELMKKKLEEKSLELEKSCKQIEELAVVTAELENMKTMNQKVMMDLQSAFELAREKELQHQEEVNNLKIHLQKTKEELGQTKTHLNESQVVKKEVHDLGKALKHQSAELEKAQRVLQEKATIEEKLSQLKAIQQKTMEELENTKKRLDESQSARKNAQETEKALKVKAGELEKALFNLDEHKAVEMSILEELDKVKEELKAKCEELEVAMKLANECESLKLDVHRTAAALQEALHEKEKLAEESSTLKESLEAALKDLKDAANIAQELGTVRSKVEELEAILATKETAVAAAEKNLEESEAIKAEILADREALIVKVEEFEKSRSLLMESEGIASELKEQLEKLKKELSDSEKLTEVESCEKQKAIQDLQRLSDEVECLRCENKVLTDKLAKQGRAAVDEMKKRNDEIQRLLKELEDTKEMISFKKMELEDINCIWAGRLNSMKVNLSSLARSLHELGRQSREIQHMFVERLRTLQNVITVNAESVVEISVAEAKKELLDEMHRMNELLKDRGEAIFKLQDTLADTEGKLDALKAHNAELSSEQGKMQSALKSKDEKIASNQSQLKELESEISKLKELRETAPESDVLSTSTISRTEDHMRLKEVDDSIEEKYLKLRQVAVKLKKRVSELTAALEQEKNKHSDKSDLLEKIQHLSSAAKNAQKVQESYDKTLDELDEAKKQINGMSAALKELNGTSESLKRQVTSLESQNANIPLMHKQFEGLNHTIKELKGEVNRLEMEKKVEVMKYEESKKHCAALEAKVESLTQSLDQAVQQGRSNNVLELEMKNYEKVVTDLTTQLNSEKQKLANSEKELSAVSLVKSGLEEQLLLLEKQLKTEESRNSSLQDQITAMREKVSSSQHQVEEVNAQLSDVKRELQHSKNQSEQQAVEMSSLSSEFSRKEIDLQGKIDSFTSHIQSLETNLATTKQELLTSNSEKEHLREEFESYRLRAQSMLARQKGDTISQGEKEAREQFEKLKRELDVAREKTENNQTEIETLNNKLSSLQLEKARSDKRYEDITKALHQKITDYDTLNTEYRAFKFSAETLLQNTKGLIQIMIRPEFSTGSNKQHDCRVTIQQYAANPATSRKIEFEEKERGLKEEVASLNDLIASLNEKVMEMQGLGMELKNNNDGPLIGFLDFQHPHDALPSLQEREDGEGSESVHPPLSNYRRLSNLVPLDILLNNPIDDENRIPVLQEQIEKLHSELNSYEVRAKHLASLLSEAEKDAARSSQQNAVLKEELRRLERSLQREPHIANSEYLKNVIFKFLVLQSGDERQRLVPVLDTILKLSPEETGRLTAVAKGETASWGSYLHSWTGL